MSRAPRPASTATRMIVRSPRPAVYIFVRTGSTWSQQAYIKASNTGTAASGDSFAEGDQFGYSMSLSADGNTLAVGAIGEDSNATGINGNQADNSANQAGAEYVFARTGTTWTQQAYIKSTMTRANVLFGYSTGISGDGTTVDLIYACCVQVVPVHANT